MEAAPGARAAAPARPDRWNRGRAGSAGSAATGGGAARVARPALPAAAGTGGVAGTGGAAGRGGTGGVAGTGGAAGRGGTGGVAARAGRPGGAARAAAAGTGGAVGRGGTGGAPCVPTAEFCYNNADDDCDGRIDCADSDCTPIAQCVPLDAGRREDRPDGGGHRDLPAELHRHDRPQPDPLRRRLRGMLVPPADAHVVQRDDLLVRQRGGLREREQRRARSKRPLSSTQACTTPNWVGSKFGTIYGVQAGAFTPTLNGSCAPRGRRRPGPPTWATTGRFCAATMVGGGCANGLVCVPIVTRRRSV